MSLIECVPNFSEGRDPAVIARIADSIASVAGTRVLDAGSDADHNRTVITLAGPPGAVAEAAVRAAGEAAALIDLTKHTGVHPRIGSTDVIPFVPLSGATLGDCAAIAVEAAEEIWARYRVPAYLYEAAARTEAHRGLEHLRSPSFRGEPDIGSGRHPTAGAVAVGARRFLVAWNIWLETADIALARQIARRIRFSSGGFPGVKALGLPLASQGIVQVSINTTDFEATPLYTVFDAVERLSHEAGVAVRGSELIGLIPERALSPGQDLRWLNWRDDPVLERRLASAGLAREM